jgi:hypothetical protein
VVRRSKVSLVHAGRLIYFADLGRIAYTVPHFGK